MASECAGCGAVNEPMALCSQCLRERAEMVKREREGWRRREQAARRAGAEAALRAHLCATDFERAMRDLDAVLGGDDAPSR